MPRAPIGGLSTRNMRIANKRKDPGSTVKWAGWGLIAIPPSLLL